MSNSFGTITIRNILNENDEHHVVVDFDGLSVIEAFGMLEMARLQVIQRGLELDDE